MMQMIRFTMCPPLGLISTSYHKIIWVSSQKNLRNRLTNRQNRDMIIDVKSCDGKSNRVLGCQRKGKLR